MWYEQLKVVDDKNDSKKWAEHLKVVVDMKDSGLWAQGSRSYEQLRVVHDINDLGSYELRPLNAMNHYGI